jgi:hypothetical protein
MFKERSSKKRTVAGQNGVPRLTTLDARHQEMIQHLSQKQSQVDSFEQELKTLYGQSNLYQSEIDTMYQSEEYDDKAYDSLWEKHLKNIDQIREIEIKLKNLKTNTEEIEYFEETASILYDYYNLLESQEATDISSTTAPPPLKPSTSKQRKKITFPPNKSILEAFSKWTEPSVETMDDTNTVDEPESTLPIQPTTSTEQIPKHKSKLVDSYLALVEPMHIQTLDVDATSEQCRFCQTVLTHLHQDGIMICNTCGNQEQLLVEQNRPVHRQTSKEANHFSYKRINHLNEWICQVQGKESTDIPESVFDMILVEIKKERIDPMKLTYNKMREILKKIKINKYYEHIPYIINRITGLPTPHFPPELEAKLRSMFNETQAPFLKHCPPERSNYLSYSFVLYKFFQLLGKHEFLKYFPLLKSREKLHNQDLIWAKVCTELGWPFYPSL